MDVNDLSEADQHDVRSPGQVASVEAETAAKGMDDPAHDDFGGRILGFDGRHYSRTLCFSEFVGHVPILEAGSLKASMSVVLFKEI